VNPAKPSSAVNAFWHELYRDRSRQFWYFQIGGWLGLALVSYLSLTLWYNTLELAYIAHTLVQSLLGIVVSLPLRHIYRLLWDKPVGKRAVSILASVVAVSLLWTVLRLVTFMWMTPETGLWTDFGGWFFSSLFIFLCWTAFYHGIKYYQLQQEEHEAVLQMSVDRNREQLMRVQAESMAREAQLKMLRYQINPHFLFNTLNAIAALIDMQDPARAREMIVGLSQFMRYSLDNDLVTKVSLEEELQALRLYLSIEQTRFGERLRVDFDVEQHALSARIPSLLLQPLVENAVKYAISPSETGGEIAVTVRRDAAWLLLEVSDDGGGEGAKAAPGVATGAGIGLRNTSDRLRALYGDAQDLSQEGRPGGGLCVRIRIPLESENSVCVPDDSVGAAP
jgi:two-component system LytT family sensor kinase